MQTRETECHLSIRPECHSPSETLAEELRGTGVIVHKETVNHRTGNPLVRLGEPVEVPRIHTRPFPMSIGLQQEMLANQI